ncbi:peptidase M48 family protein [Natrialba magadii ATCC 43099]|uniref:Heat shock protein HtpX n=1 Tax=Natrialba magadii (strain ATCC 43099 / DSM 3394 / CCM 3739 / CIP 104546 / IAM 13178 / JCM 8861 / NBRC 102185 / NCIMB 2190 / MS3) TaxID=547559 RepID=D3SQR4_NATMM|nr:M48 family metalloprotease [Natrialba magadii]ADD04552.1 peptidase M48 family protein [Natrialba magadii ATCC 43099]ELY25209.1 heat shock protein HtpX [Natrialba magadii ATCC 43099]
MRLTGPIGIGVRALLGAGITAVTLLASAYVITVFAAAVLIFVAMQLGPLEFTETGFLWALAIGAIPVLPCFAIVIAHAIRLERVELLEGTVPAAEIDANGGRTLEASATRLATQFDIATPEVRVRSDTTPLAYTTARPTDPVLAVRRRSSPVIVVSKGLVQTLSSAELEAVLAHECAHLANDDLQLISWLLVPLFAAEFLYEAHEDDEDSEDNEDKQWQLDPLGWTLTSLSLVGLGVFSRGRELAADRAAVEATGDPGALASALERLANRRHRRRRRPSTDLRHAQSTNAINIMPTLGEGGDLGGLRSTHPPLEVRLRELRSVAAA